MQLQDLEKQNLHRLLKKKHIVQTSSALNCGACFTTALPLTE